MGGSGSATTGAEEITLGGGVSGKVGSGVGFELTLGGGVSGKVGSYC